MRQKILQSLSNIMWSLLLNSIEFILLKADIMFATDCEIVIFGFHHNEQRGHMWTYSPPDSIGEAFLADQRGVYASKMFNKFVVGKRKGCVIIR